MSVAKRMTILLAATILVSIDASGVIAAEWGSLKGRFVVNGQPPRPEPLVVTKDQYCIDKKPMDHSVVVGENGGLANAVVYIRLGRRDTIDVHPDYAKQLSEPAVLDNTSCHFEPHIVLVRKGQSIVIKNSDPVGHNTNLVAFAFNQTIPAGGETKTTISRAAPLPTPVQCNIHPFMKGYVLAQDHPYMAVSADDGTFEVKNIPAGKHPFTFWHEVPGYLKNLKFSGGSTDRRGGVEVTIKAGETLDLGEIKVSAAVLK